jgi:transcriptional regulator with XRE-family HTH domain
VLSAAPITFGLLRRRLLLAASQRICNGDFTERGLARLIDVSQPHVHNILKGRKSLSPEVADALLTGLSLSLLDLLTPEELGSALLDRQPAPASSTLVPVLHGRLGPEDPYPEARSISQWFRASSPILGNARRPCLVECAADRENNHFPSPACALLDLDESARLHTSPSSWFALRWRGAGYIRRIRRHHGALLVLGQTSSDPGPCALPHRLELNDASILHVVRARVLWVGPDPRLADPFAQPSALFLAADS